MSDLDNDQDYAHRKLVNQVVSSAFSNITDSIIDTHTAIKVLAITVTAEIFGLVMLFVANDKVTQSLAESDSDLWLYVALAVFAVGFLTTFALYRLVAEKWPHVGDWLLVWVVSIGAGALNIFIFLFFALVTLDMR